jgi:hypothetical protein
MSRAGFSRDSIFVPGPLEEYTQPPERAKESTSIVILGMHSGQFEGKACFTLYCEPAPKNAMNHQDTKTPREPTPKEADEVPSRPVAPAPHVNINV